MVNMALWQEKKVYALTTALWQKKTWAENMARIEKIMTMILNKLNVNMVSDSRKSFPVNMTPWQNKLRKLTVNMALWQKRKLSQ